MKVYDQIKSMLCDELEEIAKKKELTSSNLEVIDKAVDVIKDLSTIEAMESEYGYSQDGYSQEGYSRGGYSGGYFGRMPYYMYDDGMSQEGGSYARGRGSNARRDSMGRYSREGRSNEGRSYEGYSGDTKEELKRLMDTAQNDREREAIRSALDQMGR